LPSEINIDNNLTPLGCAVLWALKILNECNTREAAKLRFTSITVLVFSFLA
jgi:hypothetical protein